MEGGFYRLPSEDEKKATSSLLALVIWAVEWRNIL
jgi:hypothetical protein